MEHVGYNPIQHMIYVISICGKLRLAFLIVPFSTSLLP
jgi:hypothetical protein